MFRNKLLHAFLLSSIILFSSVNLEVRAFDVAETSKEKREKTESEKRKTIQKKKATRRNGSPHSNKIIQFCS